MTGIEKIYQNAYASGAVSDVSATKEEQGVGRMGHRPPPPPPAESSFDTYSMSEDALDAMVEAVTEEVEKASNETIFDYMDEEEVVDYDALGIAEEDMDFSEYEEFADVSDVDSENPEVDGENADVEGSDGDIAVEDGDVEVEDGDIEAEDADIEGESGDVDVDSEVVAPEVSRVNGYVRSLSADDLAMLQAAYNGNQMLTWEGSSLYDYLDSGSSSDSVYNADSSFDLDSLLASLGITLDSTTDSKDDVEDSDSSDEVTDDSVVGETEEVEADSESEE